MSRQANNSISSRIKPMLACTLLLLLLVSAANGQFKPCDDREVTENIVFGEPAANFKPLRIFYMPSASFPDEARENGTFGTVSLKVRFLAGGTIGKIHVIQGLPDGLTEEAVKAAKAIRFLPARLNGRLANSAETVEYHFPEPGKCGSINELALFKPEPKI